MENFNLIFIVDRRSLEKVHHIKTMYVLPFSIYVTIIIKSNRGCNQSNFSSFEDQIYAFS